MTHLQATLNGSVITPEENEPLDRTECMRCGTDNDVESHHISYVPEQKVALCRQCHQRVHNSGGSAFEPAQDATDLFAAPSEDYDAPESANVTIKNINDNSYFYWNWRDGGHVRSEFICPVAEAASHELYIGPGGDQR